MIFLAEAVPTVSAPIPSPGPYRPVRKAAAYSAPCRCQHDAAGKLGVPLVLHSFYGVPERCPVCISGRRMGWQHDLGVDKLFLLVVEFRFLVVLAEQPFAALVSGPGNSGLSLAALDDGDFEMRTRNRHHPQTKRPPSKIALDERSGIVFGFARRLRPECRALRS